MNWLQDYQLFLFDFDGVLVDTEHWHFVAYQMLCKRRGYQLTWDFTQFCREAHAKSMGVWEGLVREFPKLFEKDPREVLYEEKKQIYIDLLKEARLEMMEGVEVLLAALSEKGIPRAVVTNSPREHIEIIKRVLPVLQTIPVWITREDYARAKPAPDGYLQAIARLGKAGDRVIGFEDSVRGIQSLKAAGVEAVLICPPALAQVGVEHFESFTQYLTSKR